jgi:hypothetical protein
MIRPQNLPRRRGVLLVAAAALALTGCVPQVAQQTPGAAGTAPDPLSTLGKLTLVDLQHADADAKAHADKVAAMCYEYLAAQLQAQSWDDPNATVAGVVSAFQKARDLQSVLRAGVSQDFQINCAPLLSDLQLNLLKLGGLGVGAVATGGVLP